MKRLHIVIASLVLAQAGPALGAQPASTQVELKMKERQLARSAPEAKRGTQQLELEQERVDQLIDDLESGRPVDPSQIDRALKRSGDLNR
jgi:hypothetical protein